MKFLLIREFNSLFRYSNTSYGMGMIGTIAKQEAEVRILDNNTVHKLYSNKDIIDYIDEFQPDVIGFSINVFNIYQTGVLVQSIKKHDPTIFLIGGGLHTFSEPQEVGDLGLEIVVKGDAELVILPLLRILKSGLRQPLSPEMLEQVKGLSGLLYRDPNTDVWGDTGSAPIVMDLDELPFVDYDLFNLADYLQHPDDFHQVTNVLITQRGCPFKCSFCQIKDGGGMNKFREHSTEYRIKNIEYLYEKYKPRHIMFYDENFTMNHEKTMEFCEAMVARGLHKKLKFFCQTNLVQKLTDDLLIAMKTAGCKEISLGIERLAPEAIRLIRKNRDSSVTMHNIDLINKHGIDLIAQCLLGFPFDTPETILEEKERFFALSDKMNIVSINNLLPLPGTAIANDSPHPKWYLDARIMSWRPSFYHLINNFINPAWDENLFGLDRQTQKAIKEVKEFFADVNISKVNSRLIMVVRVFERMLGHISYRLYLMSPALEHIVFFIPKFVRMKMWGYLAAKFWHNTKEKQGS